MKVLPTALPQVLLFEPVVHADARGCTYESYRQDVFRAATGFTGEFVQENQAESLAGVLRGLHYQLPRAQGKLVRATRGRIFDVAVDLRRASPHFGRWVGVELSAANRLQMWIPPGFAHGFLAMDDASVHYKLSASYAPEDERCIAWDDPDLAIAWPVAGAPRLSARDAFAGRLAVSETFSNVE